MLTIANAAHQINEEILDKEVRLIGAQGEQLGIMSAEEALKVAAEHDLDLVKIAPGSNPPVCKVMDYGKFRFEQTKKEKEAKKNQRVIEVKEIRMSPGIDTNDFNTKLKNGQKFLNEGNRLKVSVRFRGREMAHTEIGETLLKDFAEKCLNAAKNAWAFLQKNPNFIFSNPSDITTGDYGDTSDIDERYWAAAQMWRATGEDTYRTALESMRVQNGMDWMEVGDYGNIAILTMDGVDTNSDLYTRAKTSILKEADKMKGLSQSNPYGVSVSKYNWGSNMGVATSGMILNLAYQMTEDGSNLHYLLGNNAMGECFVTGYGTVSPEHPHHRPSMAKNQAMKGMLVGGVNSGLEDSAAKAYCANSPSAKCYVDHWESYSTNEITIYWNSPLTCLLAMNSTARTPGHDDIISGDVNQDQTVNTADVVLLQKYLLGEVSLTETQAKAADVQADNTVNGFDLAVLRQKLTA